MSKPYFGNDALVGVDGIPKTRVEMKLALDTNYIIPQFRNGGITVDKLLDTCDMRLEWYIPSVHAIDFMNFIRLCLGEEPENTNPKAHYFFMDCIFQQDCVKPYFTIRGIDFDLLKGETVILASREFSKSTLISYLILYMAAKGRMPGFKNAINYGLYVSDSMRNNVKTTMEKLGKIYYESGYLQGIFEEVRLNQDEVSFIRKPTTKAELEAYNEIVTVQKRDKKYVPGRMKRSFALTGLGASALPLDSVLYTDRGITTIGDVKVGDEVLGDDGKFAAVTQKSEVFNKAIWKILLEDGRSIRVSDDHINNIYYKRETSRATGRKVKFVEDNLRTLELITKEVVHVHPSGTRRHKLFIKDVEPIEYSTKEYGIDPYTLGLLLGDGHMSSDGSTRLECLADDVAIMVDKSEWATINVNPVKQREGRGKMARASFVGMTKHIEDVGLRGCIGENKRVPREYMYGDKAQRLEMLRGLVDSDGQVSKKGYCRFDNISKGLVEDVQQLARSIGGKAWKVSMQDRSNKGWANIYSIIFRVPQCPSYLKRKYDRWKEEDLCRYTAIESIVEVETVPSQCIAIDNPNRLYVSGDKEGLFVVTHNTGGRRSK